jgi:hypothetical protein
VATAEEVRSVLAAATARVEATRELYDAAVVSDRHDNQHAHRKLSCLHFGRDVCCRRLWLFAGVAAITKTVLIAFFVWSRHVLRMRGPCACVTAARGCPQHAVEGASEGFQLPADAVGVGDGVARPWQPRRLDHVPTAKEFRDLVRRREPFVLSMNHRADDNDGGDAANPPLSAEHGVPAMPASSAASSSAAISVGTSTSSASADVPTSPARLGGGGDAAGDARACGVCAAAVTLAGHDRWQQHLMGTYHRMTALERAACAVRSRGDVYGLRMPYVWSAIGRCSCGRGRWWWCAHAVRQSTKRLQGNRNSRLHMCFQPCPARYPHDARSTEEYDQAAMCRFVSFLFPSLRHGACVASGPHACALPRSFAMLPHRCYLRHSGGFTHEGTWNVGSAEAVNAGDGGGWMVGVAPVSLAAVEAAISGGTDVDTLHAAGSSSSNSFQACATDVQEWLVSDGANWVLDGAITTTAAAAASASAARTTTTITTTTTTTGAAAVDDRQGRGAERKEVDGGDGDVDGGLVEECQRVPSGHVGGGVEKFGCSSSQQGRPRRRERGSGCPPLLTALGWDRVCTHWDAE